MNYKISFLFLLMALMSCKKDTTTSKTYSKHQYLISAKELKEIGKEEGIKIIDFRKESAYKKEHIANAIHLWRDHIVNKNYGYDGMMPIPNEIEKLFSELGIKSTDHLVIYDDRGLCEAARLWWILQNYSFTNVKLLQGGLQSWKQISGETNNTIPSFTKTNFKLPKEKSMKYYIAKDDVKQQLSTSILIDTRTKDEYLGKYQKKGAAKAGRIANSLHLDWAETIHYHGDQSLKSIEELEKIYSNLNIDKNDSIILYCHSGVRSAHTTFVLTQLLGYKNVKNYDGSWIEWSRFNELPYEN